MHLYIPEHIPSENKGEEAILYGFSDGLREQIKNVKVTVFSYEPDIDEKNFSSDIHVVDGITFRPPYKNNSRTAKLTTLLNCWLQILSFTVCYRLLGVKALYLFRGNNWRTLIEADIILVGHDGLFSDINLPFALIVKVLKKKSVIFGIGFDRFAFRVTEKLAPHILPLVDLIVVREKRTHDYLSSLTPNPEKVLLRPDPAFLMKPADSALVDDMLLMEGITKVTKPLIGVIITVGLAYHKFNDGHFENDSARFDSYMNFFARAVENIINITDGTIVFIPHCLKSANWQTDDRVCGQKIKERMVALGNHVILMENNYNAPLLKGFMRKLDFLVSMRLHAVIGAASMGIPFIMVAVKEDQRAHDIIGNCVGAPDLLFDINDPDIKGFANYFKEKWDSRNAIRQNLLQQSASILKETREAFALLANLKKN